jgi:protein TonB
LPIDPAVRSLPFVLSFLVHAGALVALAVTVTRKPSERAPGHAFLALEEAAPSPCPPDEPPPEVVPEDSPPPDMVIEPEREAEPEPTTIDYEDWERCEPISLRSPAAPPVVRIPALPHREKKPEAKPPAPVPVAAASAPVVRAAVPRAEGCKPPRYPVSAQRLGLEGRVVLRVEVSAEGIPVCVEVEQSSGHEILDEAALAAVREYVFVPASEDGRAVASVVHIPFNFRLRS